MEKLLSTKRNIDIVFCIDGTGSMASCIEFIKTNIKKLYDEIMNRFIYTDNWTIRIKAIVFKNDDSDTFEISPFFKLSEENNDFENFMNNIKVGGNSSANNGLEALYCAMQSDFTTESKDRQIIVLLTDNDALPLKTIDEDTFIDTWTCNNQYLKLREKLKKLVIFAPEKSKYADLLLKFNRMFYRPVKASNGLSEVSFEEIVTLLLASASNC